jgi:hypothetical protein
MIFIIDFVGRVGGRIVFHEYLEGAREEGVV